MAALLEVKRLEAFYGQTQVLHGVDFSLQAENITTILGANGAGKTTTLRAISGMVQTRGEILFDGIPLAGKSTELIVRHRIAHVPEGREIFERLTSEENLRLGAMIRKDKSEIEADIERMYSYFPILKKRRNQQAGTLSGGEQQMLVIARALMLRPRLLLLDEPSFGLAPILVRSVFENLRQVNERQRVCMLIVEQNAILALELANQAYLLENGKVVKSGRAKEIENDFSIRRSYFGY